MIRTKFPITIEIDDKPFSIVVAEKMSQAQQSELDEVTDKYKSDYEKKDTLQASLSEAIEEFEINKHILADGKVIDRVIVMFEQKALNKTIFNLKKEITELDRNIVGLNKAIAELFEKRYDLSVSGTDAAILKKEISDLGIGFQAIFNELGILIKEAKEKK